MSREAIVEREPDSPARTPPRQSARSRLAGGVVALGILYCAGLFGWKALQLLLGDRWLWLLLVNALGPYLFLPAPLVLGLGLLLRCGYLALAGLVAVALWVGIYGALWLPRLPASPPPAGPSLTVMTWNVLGHNQDPAGVTAAIAESGADVVALQEVNLAVAASIRRDLAARYPYQVVMPESTVMGMGVISRYPVRTVTAELPPGSIGPPQALEIDVNGRSIMLVNFHAPSIVLDRAGLFWPEPNLRARERLAQAIAALGTGQPRPFIALGDLNATDQHRAYALMTNPLRDAWREAGWGYGHTFPGAGSPGSSATLYDRPLPRWLVRIDHIFFSEHWRATEARIGPWDGVSDHRPVVARLALREP